MGRNKGITEIRTSVMSLGLRSLFFAAAPAPTPQGQSPTPPFAARCRYCRHDRPLPPSFCRLRRLFAAGSFVRGGMQRSFSLFPLSAARLPPSA